MLSVLIGLQLSGMVAVNAGEVVSTVDAVQMSQGTSGSTVILTGVVHVPAGTGCPESNLDSFGFDTSNLSAELFAKHHAFLLSALTTGEPVKFSYTPEDVFPPYGIMICYLDAITLIP